MFKLLRYFLIASLLSIAVVSIGFGWQINQRATAVLVKFGEAGNEEVTRIVANTHREPLKAFLDLAPGLSTYQLAVDAQTAKLHGLMAGALKGSRTIKVNIFTPDGRTVYSSEARQIGEDRSQNTGFVAALAGKTATEMTRQDHLSAFGQQLENRHIVSSYLPLRLGTGKQIDGVFEVHQDISEYVAAGNATQQAAITKVVGILFLLYGVLFLIVRHADRVLQRQSKQGLADTEALQAAHRELSQQVADMRKSDWRRDRYLALSKLASDWFWEQDANFRFVDFDVSEDVNLIFSHTAQLGKTRWELANSSPVNMTWEQHKAEVQAHKPFRDLIIRLKVPADVRFVSISGEPLFAADGSFAGYRGVGSDVTQRIMNERSMTSMRADLAVRDAAKDRAKFLQELLDALPVGVALFDADLCVVAANVASSRILDVPPELMHQGTKLENLYRFIAGRGEFGPGDKEPFIAERMDFARKRIRRSLERKRHDGKTLHINSLPLDNGNLLSVYTDVSDRRDRDDLLLENGRKANEQAAFLQNLLDAMPVGVALIDKNMQVLVANAACAALQGLPASMMKTGTSIIDAFRYQAERGVYGPGEVAQLVAERVSRTNETAPVHVERRMPNGATVDVRGKHLPNGLRLTTFIDVTERKDAELKLLAAKEAAESGSKAKSDFLAVMSHEIRTPMNAVIGLLELLRMSRLDAEQRDTVDAVRESSKSLLRLIDDVLDFSKIESGKLELHEEAASLTQLFDTAYQNYGAAASQKGVLLVQKVDPRIAPALVLDPLRLRQIINNLLSNAIKFTERGRVQLAVELLGQNEEAELVRITVEDTGVGIKPGALARVFEPFSQADSSVERTYGGTGLGLAICQRLAELMGSKIEVQSEPGFGTSIGITLRLRRAFVDASAPPKTLAIEAIAKQLHGQNAPTVDEARAAGNLILVVDDHPVNRRLMARQLNVLGYAAQTASDGHEALNTLSAGGFGLVITDCQMPVMDGYHLATAIRQREAGKTRLPIIACTANVSHEALAQCHAVGMDDAFTKPVELAVLKQILDHWLPLVNDTVFLEAEEVEPRMPLNTDFGGLEELTQGDSALQNDLLEDFRKANAEDLKAATIAVKNVAIDDLRRSAHRIKGAAKMFGATQLAAAATRLEQASHAGDWQRAADAWPAMREECQRLDERIAQGR